MRLGLLFLCASTLFAQDPDWPQESGPDFQQKRAEWFLGRHHFPIDARLKAIDQIQRLRARQAALRPLAASTTKWTNIGPAPLVNNLSGNQAGRVNAIAVDPRDANTVYIGTAESGVWKTKDGGTTWTPLTDYQASPAIGSLAIDPSHPDTVFAGTGDPVGYPGAGILKSTDAGATWTLISQPFATGYGGMRISSIAVHPTNSQIVLAGVEPANVGVANSAIYRSTDGGLTWTAVLNATYGEQVLFNPANGNIAYAALFDRANTNPKYGVYQSLDAGLTWNPANGSGTRAISLTGITSTRIAISRSSPGTLYAAIGGSSLLGLYRTDDGGASWTLLPNAKNYCSTQCGYSNTLQVHPSDPNTVYTGGVFTYRSKDGGNTWNDVTGGYVDTHAIEFSNGAARMYLGNDGGIWVTTVPLNFGPAYTSLNNTLSLTQFYPGISLHPTNINNAYGGAQDTGLHLYTGAPAWNFNYTFFGGGCGDAGWTAIDYLNPTTVYMACFDYVVWKSLDGTSFNKFSNGIVNTDPKDFLPPLVIDPVNPQRLYYATNRIYQTKDGAATWTPISTPLVANSGVIANVVVAPNAPDTVYTASSDGRVYVTNNASAGTAATWTNHSPTSSFGFRALAVDPHNSQVVYVASISFSGPRLFRSTSGGASWTDITGSFPNIPIEDLLIDPDFPGVIYAATDLGILVSPDNGITWEPLGTGLPYVSVTSMKLHRPTRTLRIGTYGRGMWDLGVPSPPPAPPSITSLSPAASSGATQALTLTINAPQGYQTLDIVDVLINTALDGRQACYLAYSRGANAFYIVADNGDAGNISPVLNNSQCSVTASSAQGSGTTLTLNLTINFNPSFNGNKVIYAAVRDLSGYNTGWQTMGVHAVPPVTPTYPNPVGMNPASGTGVTQTITFTYQDQFNSANFQTVWALINTAIDGRGACYVAYYKPGNQLYLIPDNGDGTQAAHISLIPSNTATLGNSQCSIAAQGSSAQASGTTLTLTLAITFKTSFAGFKGVWMAAQNLSALSSPWQALGALSVPPQ